MLPRAGSKGYENRASSVSWLDVVKTYQTIDQSYGFVWSAPYVTKSEPDIPMGRYQWLGV